MNKKRNVVLIISIAIIAIIVCILLYFIKKDDNEAEISTESTNIVVEYDVEELSGNWDETSASNIVLKDEGITSDGGGVIVNNNAITIKSSGTYHLTGSISNGNVIVDTNDNAEVQIILSNASIISNNTAPINVIKAGKVTITLEDNTTNYIEDSSNYTYFTDAENKEPDAAIFSKSDLVINGEGTLKLISNYLDGIVSKDTLKIISSTIDITSKDDGIRGKDFVAINGASINISSQSDGIKSTNTDDSSLGYILIEDSNIKISSGNDGIQAETILNIKNSTINIETQGEVKTHSSDMGGMFRGNQSLETDTESSKGIKAGSEITIKSGNITINSTDDSIHSNGFIIIDDGIISLVSGDDGIHADTNIKINGGTIDITKSYEGIESSCIEIEGGKISVVATDDGINVAGGNDDSSISGRMGQNNFNTVSDSNRKLVINGGEIFVSSDGDGLDSNGSIYMTGGMVIVAGPTSSGNGILDFDSTFQITGGTLIGYGSAGMLQNPSESSTQYTIVVSTNGNNGDTISLKDNSGNELINTETEKSYSAIIISTPELKKGNSYTVYKNDTQITNVTVDSIVSGNTSGGMQMQNNGRNNKKKDGTNMR